MVESLIWISGASSGIGRALVDTVPWPSSRLIGISRSHPAGIKHVKADLSEPGDWGIVAASFAREVAVFSGERVVFIHAAGTVDPVGFAGEVDTERYARAMVLNAASPAVLGHMFLAATAGLDARRHLVTLTSGAAKSVYPGWSCYGAGKAAVDQWVRNAGAEQVLRGGAQILAIAPGTVDTPMQAALRATGDADFPSRRKFTDLHAAGKLASPQEVARRIWSVVCSDVATGSVLDLRDLPAPGQLPGPG